MKEILFKGLITLEMAKKMEELGFPQNSLFYWCQYISYDDKGELTTDWFLKNKKEAIKYSSIIISAYTVGELGEFLKKENCSSGYSEEDVGWWCQSSLHDIYDVKEIDTEANARAKLAIYLAEKGLLDTKTLG